MMLPLDNTKTPGRDKLTHLREIEVQYTSHWLLFMFVVINMVSFIGLMWGDALGVTLEFILITTAALAAPYSSIFSTIASLLYFIMPLFLFQNPAPASLLSVMSVFYICRQREMLKNMNEKPFKDFPWHLRISFVLLFYDMRTSLRGDACAPLHQRTQMVSDILVTLVCAAGSIGCGLMATTVLYQEEKHLLTFGSCAFRMIIWAFACVFAIVGVDYYYAAAFQGMGYVVQKSFVEPWKAVSLAEFWGRRWNRVVQRVLHKAVYDPLFPLFGTYPAVFFTFIASGLLHAIPLAIALSYTSVSFWVGVGGTVSMFSFFPLHGLLVMVGKKLKLSRSSAVLSRGVTAVVLFMTIFMVTEPFFLLFEPSYEFPCLMGVVKSLMSLYRF